MKLFQYTIALLVGATLTSCGEDWLTELPTDVATSEQIEKVAEKNPQAVLGPQLNAIYSLWNTRQAASSGIVDHSSRGFGGLMLLSDVMSNDISLTRDSDPFHFDRMLDYSDQLYMRSGWPWGFFHTIVKNANTVIAAVDPAKANEEGKAMLGQALALRGVSFYYLSQFYSKAYTTSGLDPAKTLCVPMNLTAAETSIKGRATLEQVTKQAEADLLKAIEMLGNWKRATKEQIDRQVAQGLLSRLYLYMGRWDDAAKMAHEARQGYALMNPTQTVDFSYQDLAASSEVMWGFDTTKETTLMFASFSSWRCSFDVGYGGQVGLGHLIDAALYNSISATDARKQLYVAPGKTVKATINGQAWDIKPYFNLKFKRVPDWLADVIYMRSAELYLTEAEALARGGKATEANTLMKEFMAQRDPQWNATNINAEQIYTQRRIELWGEGFAYYDTKRLGKNLVRKYDGSNESPGLQVNIPASSDRWTFQLPLIEIQENDNITEDQQNPLKID